MKKSTQTTFSFMLISQKDGSLYNSGEPYNEFDFESTKDDAESAYKIARDANEAIGYVVFENIWNNVNDGDLESSESIFEFSE